MRYEVDQSNKIEQTERDTVIAISNGKRISLLLKRKDKRKLQDFFRKQNEPRVFIYFVFAAILAILLSKINTKSQIYVDQEYLEKEDLIRLKLKEYLARLKCSSIYHNVNFGFIGKKSPAHSYASKVSSGELKPEKIVNIDDILKLIGRVRHKK